MNDECLLLRRLGQRLQIVIEYSMRGFFLLALRTHRKKPGWFIDDDDRIVKMDDTEAVVLQSRITRRFTDGDRDDVARRQPGIVPDVFRALKRDRAEPQERLGLFA